ncbi:hypothetical protein HPHPH27_1152 [Helicobacter pylori Hp H-27]|uniref:Uncharacterized protein n=1 Tax=Helicobacter pylori Hp P-15 TaxID=992080 RepID=J0F649_HELPX|nr:hypothetical protein HPHPH27_1152 [Helicobacter pylori Hp H-27]EJC07514.1 hypothetical protein HPHPP15_0847 [Helicobacter pylori Hp P-15]EJC32283.1 hypothetical protein HPHPP15B_1117 [Helicobacter pylori Hp P-15b]
MLFFCPIFSASVCASNKRGSVLVGALKRFKQKFHSPKPIKTHFFNQLIF